MAADPIGLLALALLFLGKKGAPSGGSSAAAAAAAGNGAKLANDPDGAKLLARANQQQALAWAPIFMDAGATPPEAQALARWAGIESSGNPHPSGGNGGGLMQVGKGFVDMGALTAQQYASLQQSSTANKLQAVLAIKYVHWCADQGARLLGSALPANPIDCVWWAYWYQQRPVDVRDVLVPLAHQLGTAEAAPMAHALAQTLTGDAAHRLHAANVVAFDSPAGAA